MKVLAYSAGGGLIAGIFLLVLFHVGSTPQVQQVSTPQPASEGLLFTKVPLVEYPVGVSNATK